MDGIGFRGCPKNISSRGKALHLGRIGRCSRLVAGFWQAVLGAFEPCAGIPAAVGGSGSVLGLRYGQ